MGSEFGIFGGLMWVHSSVLVDEPGLGRVRILVFPNLDLGLAHFRPNRFEVWVSWRGLYGFKVQFWWMNLGLSEFEVQLDFPVS